MKKTHVIKSERVAGGYRVYCKCGGFEYVDKKRIYGMIIANMHLAEVDSTHPLAQARDRRLDKHS